MRRLIALLFLWPALAWAQPPSQPSNQNVVVLRPAEKDTVGCRWERQMVSATASIRRVGVGAQTDNNPSGMITSGPTASRNMVVIQLRPDNGCLTPGCRKGNTYQVDLTGTDSDSNTPMCAIKLQVKEVTF